MDTKFLKTITALTVGALTIVALLYYFGSADEYQKSINAWHPVVNDGEHFI